MKRISLSIILVCIASVFGYPQQKPVETQASPVQKSDSQFVPPASIFGKENLKTLSITDSSLRAADPIPGEKDEYPEFTRELLRVQWRDGDPIDIYIIKPHGVAKPPAVLYQYSYPSESDRFRDNEYCKRVTSNGFAAIGFVSALNGQRYHDRPMKEWFVSEMPEALVESVHDVQMAIRFLLERGDVDGDHIGIFDTGSGATIAILAASVEPRLRAVEALQPWGDWPTWLAKSTLIPESERPSYLKPEFLASVAPWDPIQWFDRLQTKAVRVQFGLDDPITPPAAVQGMKKAISASIQVVEYPTTRQQYQLLRAGHAFDWIKDQLRPPDPRSATATANSAGP